MSAVIRAEILAHAANGTLLHAVFHVYGRRWLDDTDPTMQALVDLHNSGKIDILAIVTHETILLFQG
ncbi:MAG: hypothetical protein E2598_08240 [Sphingobium sp.]|nr:hypothetical protein [Sphingobium sp.]